MRRPSWRCARCPDQHRRRIRRLLARQPHVAEGIHAPRFESEPRALAYARRLGEFLQSADTKRWRAAPPAGNRDPVSGHIFFLGFPRSGTTLLEVVLEGHPDVVSLEENELLIDSACANSCGARGSRAALRAMPRYWSAARSILGRLAPVPASTCRDKSSWTSIRSTRSSCRSSHACSRSEDPVRLSRSARCRLELLSASISNERADLRTADAAGRRALLRCRHAARRLPHQRPEARYVPRAARGCRD